MKTNQAGLQKRPHFFLLAPLLISCLVLIAAFLVHSPSHRPALAGVHCFSARVSPPGGGALPAPAWDILYLPCPPSGICACLAFSHSWGGQLTMTARFLSALPGSCAGGQDLQLMADMGSALFAGLFWAGSCILLFLFLLMLRLGFPDAGVLLLAASSLALCISQLALCFDLAAAAARFELILLAQNLSFLFLIWLLWLKLSPGPLKKGLLLLASGSTGALLALPFLQAAPGTRLGFAIDQLQHFWLPLGFFLLLAGGVDSALRRNAWYRSLFFTAGCVMAVTLVMIPLLHLLTGHARLAVPMAGPVQQHSLFPLQFWLTVFILSAAFLLTVARFGRRMMEQAQALRLSELHSRLASEHADALYRTLLETRAVRHEIRHRTETLRALCREGDLQRIRAYVEQFCEESQIAPSLYTANTLVNALAAPRFQAAQDKGIQVSASIQVPETLSIADLDLSTILSNLLDNAVAAAARVPAGQPRELTFRMELERGRLHILCRNSYTGTIQLKADGLPASRSGEWHGCGIRLVRQAVQKYDGFLDIQYDSSLFTVRAVLLVPPKA